MILNFYDEQKHHTMDTLLLLLLPLTLWRFVVFLSLAVNNERILSYWKLIQTNAIVQCNANISKVKISDDFYAVITEILRNLPQSKAITSLHHRNNLTSVRVDFHSRVIFMWVNARRSCAHMAMFGRSMVM